jgi:hypothetical protein
VVEFVVLCGEYGTEIYGKFLIFFNGIVGVRANRWTERNVCDDWNVDCVGGLDEWVVVSYDKGGEEAVVGGTDSRGG